MMLLYSAASALKDQLRARGLDDRGAVTIEYGVLAVFIALALITVVGVLVTGIGGWFDNISSFIQTQPDGSQGPPAGGNSGGGN